MSRVTQETEDCNAIPTAKRSNTDTASTESVPEGNVSNKSGEEQQESKTLMLSRELALFINPKQADLTASLLIYGLYTWQVSRRNFFGYNPKINGKPCCYRSFRELAGAYPWLHHTGIRKALHRAAKALKDDFIMQLVKKGDQEQCHFLLSDKLIKKYKFDCSVPYSKLDQQGKEVCYWKRRKAGLISLQRSDAIKYGLFEAILISNLHHVVDAEHNVAPLEDEVGNIYRHLSPGALTKPVRQDDGMMKAPLPVSRDTAQRALERLKNDGMFYEHPQQNNYFTLVSTMKPLKVDAAEVNTHAAEVNTYAAEVNTKTEVVDCKCNDNNDLQSKNETPDSSRDRNADRKCVIQPISSLRSDITCGDANLSDGAKKLMQLVKEGLSEFRQRDKTAVSKFNINDCAVYRVDDYDRVTLVGYELDHEFVKADWQTGKPYTRELEIDNYVAECEMLFGFNELRYTNADKAKLRSLFVDHPKFTPDIINDLICHDYLDGIPAKPKKGHDFYYFARKLTSVKYFLRYLPQLIKEKYLNSMSVEADHHPVTKKPMFDYSGMEQSLMKIAFASTSTPVTWYYVPLREERPEVGCYLEGGVWRKFLTGETILVKTTRVKEASYEEFTDTEIEWVAYEVTHSPGDRLHSKMMALPLLWEEHPQPREFSSVAIRHWKQKNGCPSDL